MRFIALFVIATIISSNFAIEWKLYKQCNGAWAQNTLSGGKTICAVGCLMSSVAMALTTFNRPCGVSPCTPGALNSWLKKNGGYVGNLFAWGAVARLGFAYLGQPSDKSVIANHCKSGKIVVLNVKRGGHWVLCTGVGSGIFNVNDPGGNRPTYPFGEVVRAGIFRKTFMTLHDLLV